MRADGASGEEIKRSSAARGFESATARHYVRFNTGDICPAGCPAGNVRRDRVAQVYRSPTVPRAARSHPVRKDGAAFASTAPRGCAPAPMQPPATLASDPICSYEPHAPGGPSRSEPPVSNFIVRDARASSISNNRRLTVVFLVSTGSKKRQCRRTSFYAAFPANYRAVTLPPIIGVPGLIGEPGLVPNAEKERSLRRPERSS
jgi:hypothetical protein